MLNPEQIHAHPDGRTVLIGPRTEETQTIGEIYSATLKFGPLSMGMLVTEQGLLDAGFACVPPEPEPVPE